MRNVVIIQKTVKLYRKRFFELLKEKCKQNDINLILIYGKDDVMIFNDVDIQWGIKIKNYSINIFGKKLYYQNVWRYLQNADLIIVEQATKYLINHILWILNLLKFKKVAFWGHGINFQNDRTKFSNISEFFKRLYTKNIHHFFAYTELSKRIAMNMGLPEKKITVLNNTIPVENLKKEIMKYDALKLQAIKKEIGVSTENVCIYLGGMYKDKRLDFLLHALKIIKEKVKDFEMIFIGDGPEREKIIEFANHNNWVHYLGKKGEKEKVPYFLISKLLLMPGLVGLVIIDSFLFATPLITTNCKLHSPEIEYLENGVNGIMMANNLESYSKAIINLLLNREKRKKLVVGCRTSAGKYTMEIMVDNFSKGIHSAIF